MKEILLVTILANLWRFVWRICILMLWCKGSIKKSNQIYHSAVLRQIHPSRINVVLIEMYCELLKLKWSCPFPLQEYADFHPKKIKSDFSYQGQIKQKPLGREKMAYWLTQLPLVKATDSCKSERQKYYIYSCLFPAHGADIKFWWKKAS